MKFDSIHQERIYFENDHIRVSIPITRMLEALQDGIGIEQCGSFENLRVSVLTDEGDIILYKGYFVRRNDTEPSLERFICLVPRREVEKALYEYIITSKSK